MQNRVSAALASLPQAVQVQGVTVQKKSTAILQIVTLTSPDGRYDSLFLSNYATISLVPRAVARSPAWATSTCSASASTAMRVWLDPQTAAGARSDAAGRDQRHPAAEPGGRRRPGRHAAGAGGQDFQYTLNVEGRLDRSGRSSRTSSSRRTARTAAQITRIQDVGRVELGAQTYTQIFTLNGKPSAGIAIYQLPDGQRARRGDSWCDAKMAELAKAFPQGLTYSIPFDTTLFVKASINEVYETLIEAGGPGADRHPGLPAGLARHAGAGDDGAGDDHRRLRGDGGAGLHHQPVDAVRHRAGHRHRGRRRHRRRRGRRRSTSSAA